MHRHVLVPPDIKWQNCNRFICSRYPKIWTAITPGNQSLAEKAESICNLWITNILYNESTQVYRLNCDTKCTIWTIIGGWNNLEKLNAKAAVKWLCFLSAVKFLGLCDKSFSLQNSQKCKKCLLQFPSAERYSIKWPFLSNQQFQNCLEETLHLAANPHI